MKTVKTETTPESDLINDEQGWEQNSKSFPPFIILDVGHVLQGILQNVRIRKKEGDKEDYLYEVKLTRDTEALDKTKSLHSFGAGEVVTLPGGGNLDSTIQDLALKAMGVKPEDFDPESSEVDYSGVVGREFRITRQPDEKMKSGPWKGNKVKRFDVKSRKVG